MFRHDALSSYALTCALLKDFHEEFMSCLEKLSGDGATAADAEAALQESDGYLVCWARVLTSAYLKKHQDLTIVMMITMMLLMLLLLLLTTAATTTTTTTANNNDDNDNHTNNTINHNTRRTTRLSCRRTPPSRTAQFYKYNYFDKIQ